HTRFSRDWSSDVCSSDLATHEQARHSMALSLRWAERSKQAHGDSPSALFGIVQGGMYEDLRRESLAGLEAMGFDGYAVGGLSVESGRAAGRGRGQGGGGG